MVTRFDREQLAWAGGFFDGEGSTSLSRSPKTTTFALAVGQTAVEPLERFQRAVGGLGKIRGPYTPKPTPTMPNRKPYWTWTCSNWRDGQAVIAMLWTFWCWPKREQATRVLERFHREIGPRLRPPMGPDGQAVRCVNGHPYTPENSVWRTSGFRICRTCYEKQIRDQVYVRVEEPCPTPGCRNMHVLTTSHCASCAAHLREAARRRPDPVRFCETCGAQLVRKRFNGGSLEPPSRFATRRHCDLVCSGKAHPLPARRNHRWASIT